MAIPKEKEWFLEHELRERLENGQIDWVYFVTHRTPEQRDAYIEYCAKHGLPEYLETTARSFYTTKVMDMEVRLQEIADELEREGWAFAIFAHKKKTAEEEGRNLRYFTLYSRRIMSEMMESHYVEMGLQEQPDTKDEEQFRRWIQDSIWMDAIADAQRALKNALYEKEDLKRREIARARAREQDEYMRTLVISDQTEGHPEYCSWCVNGSDARAGDKRFVCPVLNREVGYRNAAYCKHYEARISNTDLSKIGRSDYDGFPIRNTVSLELHTANQWYDAGRRVKSDARGLEMHPTAMSKITCMYYFRDETIEL